MLAFWASLANEVFSWTMHPATAACAWGFPLRFETSGWIFFLDGIGWTYFVSRDTRWHALYVSVCFVASYDIVIVFLSS